MIEVPRLSYFSPNSLITAFTGKNYEESSQKAQDWALQYFGKVRLISYYKQKAFGRSILVEYEKSNENE